jgi:hypothetical protein
MKPAKTGSERRKEKKKEIRRPVAYAQAKNVQPYIVELYRSLSASITNSSIKTEEDLTISALRIGKLSSPIAVVSTLLPWNFTS